jgi:hypothetical protein
MPTINLNNLIIEKASEIYTLKDSSKIAIIDGLFESAKDDIYLYLKNIYPNSDVFINYCINENETADIFIKSRKDGSTCVFNIIFPYNTNDCANEREALYYKGMNVFWLFGKIDTEGVNLSAGKYYNGIYKYYLYYEESSWKIECNKFLSSSFIVPLELLSIGRAEDKNEYVIKNA